MKTFRIQTLGCKANFADSATLSRRFAESGWTLADAQTAPDVCVINSCAVTDEADRETRRLAGRLLKKFPLTRVLVTGCSAEIDPERLAAESSVRYVVGNRDRDRLVELLEAAMAQEVPPTPGGAVLGRAQGYAEMRSVHPMDREWSSVEEDGGVARPELTGRTRVFLKIQEGCNAFCTYCVIPYGRGPSRSLDAAAIVAKISVLAQAGMREVVLTGTNLGDFEDEGVGFTDLVERILDETPLERLRLSSLDPAEIDDRLLARMARDPRLCPHFHVSLQSTEDRILRLMKRKYRRARASDRLRAIASIRAPGTGRAPFVGMDLICGFPGETEADHAQTLAFLQAHPWHRLHVFPYSERAGTPATRLPASVAREVRVRRARDLQAMSLARLQSVMNGVLTSGARLGDVLLEAPFPLRDGETRERVQPGYTPDYLRVLIRADEEGAESSVSTRRPGRNERVAVMPRGLWVDAGAGEVALRATLES